MDLVSVVIPTLNRPGPLQRAVRSLMCQRDLDDVKLDVLVVDNSPDGNARDATERLRTETEVAITYVSAPNPGVSNARNAGVESARGRWIAFLDDDEEADPDWIKALVTVVRQTEADAVFGAIEARAESAAAVGEFANYFQRTLDAPDGADITDRAAYLGTNNSMFDRARCFAGTQPFDVTLNQFGGEDSLLLQRLVLAQRRFAWAPQARVVEWVPDSRLNWLYVRRRKFLSGQIRVFVLGMLQPAQWPAMAGWMAVGFVQSVIGGAAMLVQLPFGGVRYWKASILCAAGMGKLLWMRRFRPRLYGTGLVS